MKICLFGEYSGDLDEGMKKVSSYFAKELSKHHDVITMDIKNVLSKNSMGKIKKFNPEILHYIHGPSINSIILLKIISLYCKNAKTVISATHPRFSIFSEQFIPLFKPDLVLSQSLESEKMFIKRGCNTKFLASGVDINKFIPVSKNRKAELREKYGVEKEKFVILHIGSIKEGRNIQLLEKVQESNNQVIIVGAISPGIDRMLAQNIEKSGCMVWTKYFENIEEIYAMSDCYIFPVLESKDAFGNTIADSIEMPLTVLEAMSCNLSVIATRFGALPRVFIEGNGLFYSKLEEDLINIINNIKNGADVKTREKVLPYSWENIGIKLEEMYNELLKGENS